RPGMYIGGTGLKGLHHILWEIIDNAIDEAANGFGDQVKVILYPDGSASVEDNGRGIPTDIHPTAKVSGVEVVFTQLHAGGKFDNDNYAFSGGLHGVGASVTNALSEWLEVEVYKGTVFKMKFKSYYDEKKKKFLSGEPQGRLKDTGKETTKKGTFIRFKPDATVFEESTEFDYGTILKRLEELAFLNKGVTITLEDKRDNLHLPVIFKYEGGIIDFVKKENFNKKAIIEEPIYFSSELNGIKAEVAFQHTERYDENILSFVNNIPTADGGTHEEGFKTAFTKVLNDYARDVKLLKDKDDNLLGEDFREGLTCIVSIKMQNVQFEGQTKGRLGNPEAKTALQAITSEQLKLLTENKKNKSIFTAIINKALGASKARKAAKQAKQLARAKNSADSFNLVGKLANCSSKKYEENEIFIVEGDSAGGSAKQGRDRQHQAILPLRGKPLNSVKKRLDEVLKNEEIRTIISALGTGIGADFDLESLKFHKVIILSDADTDGAHIRAILLAFFYGYMRPLIEAGHVYIGMPPLYKVYKKDVEEYAYDDNELKEKIEKVGRGYQIQRYKGLGEMNPEQLWETTMNPKTRLLMKVTLEDAAKTEELISTLLGDALPERKAYIQKYADFDKKDAFMDKVSIKKGDADGRE
ncbi:MAG: DNA gyrase subunit B, partial [Clostridia bacterium]|nr:DNA gyrase subunit B [Clostridia bacterium]